MLRILTRSRTLTRIRFVNLRSRRALYSAAGSNPDGFTSSSSSTSSGASDPGLGSPSNSTARKFLYPLKFGIFGMIAGTLSAAGYATYAYTTDEVDVKTKSFRSSINHDMEKTMAGVDKLQDVVYTAVMTVPAKVIDLYVDLRRSVSERMQELADPSSDKLLPDMDLNEQQGGIFTLVLDLRETLIHNEWKRETGWRTYKRPGLDVFLKHLAQFFEIVVYTDEPFVDDIMQKLNPIGVRYHLTRSATKYQDGKHYRDLSKLNRDPSRILYVSGHALENCLQHENCVPIKAWRKEVDDTALIDLIPFLEFVALHRPADIRPVLSSYHGKDIPSEFIKRTKEHQRLMLEKKQQGVRWGRKRN